MSRYAIIDIETTGLSLAHHHRIIEIGVVLVNDDGNIAHEWDTLVNPQRDIGATEIHGLTAADVYAAPTFDQVSSELRSLFCGRVPVAHNLSFDAPFLAAEFERLGYFVPLNPTCGLCTMRLASMYLSAGPRTLEACCNYIGHTIDLAHSALSDARATAQLLSHYIQNNDFLDSWIDIIETAQLSSWPDIPVTEFARVTRRSTPSISSQHFLGRLASRTPRSEMHPEANSYLALLDRVLLDRQLSQHEQDELVAAAQMMGLSREDAVSIHRTYLSALGRLALQDGIVTREERSDLESVAALLELSMEDVDSSLDPRCQVAVEDYEVGKLMLKIGDSVVFTGEASGINRSELEYQARTLGLRVTGSVSSKTNLLIAADPDSISGKARKARNLDIPIIDYQTYIKMLDSIT